ncbi:ankyrin repeat-containing protein ITN1-like [Corylus avellana]|uniref:ankyrin repeat-containing protein ITN1-like n=1 Tax=Corylus avellana TaxID=13451 RepID=UPI00286AF1F0|nr:ankyrin repeat-containing protein ITN1-like [Corylus avellana]
MKLISAQCHELMHHMCEQISNSNLQQRVKGGVYAAIFCAIKNGIFEFVFDVVKANSELLRSFDRDSRTIFSTAVLYRQAKIFSLIYGLEAKNLLTYYSDVHGNHILHMAGMSAASTLINRIPGAALQMQRELQWFKEVETIVHPKVKEATNKDGLTPRQLFTEKHKDMMQAGEQWMKDTSTSCTVVAALIVTIMFAAAFTVPGGNNQDTGFPVFLHKKLFMLFIISDALSLFSSSTSVLMFLGILTSRYAEEDFLKSLPTKMIIGLSMLFFSIATMMIAFSAALLIMLHGQSWLVIPIICLASVPVTLFILMQFPLLLDMSISTFGPGIFDRKMKRWV